MEETIDKSVTENGSDQFSLEKASRVGGPVTCVAFSPIDSSTQPDDQSRPSFFFVAQGPYLIRYNNNGSKNTFGDCNDVDAASSLGVGNCKTQAKEEQQLLVFPEDERRPRGGGTIHGIHFLEQETNIATSWDAVLYGGKRLAFCNLLDSTIGRRNVIRLSEEGAETETPSTMGGNGSSLSPISPFMELDDWIWNVKTFPKNSFDNHDGDSDDDNSTEPNEKPHLNTKKAEMTMVVGYARHMIEVWNVKEAINGIQETISSTRLRRFFLSPPTVVTSMDFVFLNDRYQRNGTSEKGDGNEIDTLWIAAGTSFHKIWISCIPVKEILSPNEDDQHGAKSDSASQIGNHHLLKGHSGVVHSVRWFRDGDRISLASTSDDRSVRKWVWDTAREQWIEKWVGWGHSARVWSVSMVQSNVLASDMPASSQPPPLLISVAEDGTARIWSSESGDVLACIHHSTTLWTVDTRNTTDGGIFITGGTDGISAIYNVCNHVSGKKMLAIDDIAVPDDRPPAITSIDALRDNGECQDNDVVLTKKKKKAKKKIQSQVIVGMKCWRDGSTNSAPTVIVATRQGSLMSFDVKERNWKTCDTWWEPYIEEKHGIQANDGKCMAVHDGISTIAIGTTHGDIILTSLHQAMGNNRIILNARKLRAVQGLAFLDSSCLVSFHVHSVALWKMEFDTFSTTTVVEPTYVLEVETKGIPQSCAYNQVNQRVVIGDSRGNLVYFRINHSHHLNGEGENHIVPTCVAHKVHQKQHITSVKWLSENAILSAGNDGCVHVSYLHGDYLQKGWSYPAPFLTGITSIVSCSVPRIVAGYHGNTYRVLDIDSGYEYIRSDTGGRQRILDCSFNIAKSNREVTPPEYQLVVCKAQKDGSNHIFVQHSKEQSAPIATEEHAHVTKGVKLHGETIFDSAFFTLTNQEVVFLVTASEDCSSRISTWKDGRIVDSVPLTPQESCCRCVTVSQIDENSALLVVGGGKLALQFFLIKERSNCTKINSARDLEISFIGNGLTSKKGATIDHRINSVNAVPFLNSEDRSHFVIAGDSEGSSHAFLISENDQQHYRNPIGFLVPTTSERPILCIETIVIGNRILILMGTTGGDIDLFDLPASLSRLQDCREHFSTVWNPIGRYHGHQMGTNTISAEILSLETTNGKMRAMVSIVSGGDDQALCISRVCLEQVDDRNTRLQLQKVPHLNVVPEASFSAIKGVSHIRFCGQRYLLSVGYSQQLSVWKFHVDDDILLQCKSRLPVDLGDVNCLSVYRSSDESTYLVAVCGMGVEMFRQGNSTHIS